jgi:hypothetical protein
MMTGLVCAHFFFLQQSRFCTRLHIPRLVPLATKHALCRAGLEVLGPDLGGALRVESCVAAGPRIWRGPRASALSSVALFRLCAAACEARCGVGAGLERL